MKNVLLLTGTLVAAMNAIAEPVKGTAELGAVSTNGNSETLNVNAKLKLLKDTEKWKYEANFGALGSSNKDQDTGEESTTAEKYTAAVKADRKLDDRSFLYAISTWEDNRFSGFEYQLTFGVGYGYKVIAEEDKTLTLEIGPGYRYNAIDTTPAIAEEDEDEVTLRLGEKFDWKFSETASLNQYVVIEGGDDNTITKAGVSITSALTGALSLKVGIDATHTKNPPIDRNDIADPTDDREFDDLDTETYATITYSF